jgi:hypothetical protein
VHLQPLISNKVVMSPASLLVKVCSVLVWSAANEGKTGKTSPFDVTGQWWKQLAQPGGAVKGSSI